MDLLPTDGAGAPARWLIVFRRSGWRLIPGRFKHVRAFAFVPECDTYIFYDVGWGSTSLFLARGRGARAAMLEWTRDAVVLAIAPLGKARVFQFALCCTTAIRHLLGLPGSTLRLTPDLLYADLRRHGAEVVHGHAEPAAAAAGDRSFA